MSDVRASYRVPSKKRLKKINELFKWFSGSTAAAGFRKMVQILEVEKDKFTEREKEFQESISKEITKNKEGDK